MGKGVYISKGLAIATVVLTVSAVSGIVLMIVMYQLQIKENPPTELPTLIPTTPIPTGPPPNLRLPDSLIPETYEVFLRPYFYAVLENNTEQTHVFRGNSTVRFRCVKDTRSIFLHALQLSVSNVKVTDYVTGKNIEVERYEVHFNKTNFFEIQLKEVMNGNGSLYELFTEFEGELLDDLAGLYMSRYTENTVNDDADQKRFLMASQMQPTDARKVFPCFDEPALKAEFNITIIHRPGTKAQSNTKGDGQYRDIDGEQWIVTKFDPTPIMSTYLLAFTVNQFKDQVDPGNKNIRIWAKPEAINAGHANYSLQITKNILAFYEERFGLKYPLSKLDQIAIPDFGAGAMENWGLIMYRETALLYEEGVSSTSNKEWIATVIAHELAHQWFGNLVTMKWWNNLWLSEGFATYISYLGVNKVEPTWDIGNLFVLKEVQPAMEVDSLNSSHPLSSTEAEIQTTAEISDLFDSISYSKGAAVLRMLHAYIGETAFFEGLKLYLNNNRYNSTDTTDLWKYMKEASTLDVESIMYGWTEQVGYPVISINTSTGEIWQEQFLLNQTGDYGLEWQVPIRYMKYPDVKTVETDLLKEKGPVAKPAYDLKPGEWLLANIDCTGYFRVNYDEENWYKLIDQMETNHHVIPLINRGQLIDDAFNLARAKYVNVTLALSTTKYLINETEYVPWESALNNLQYFILMFDRSEVYGQMQKYLRKQVGPLYDYFQEYTDNATVPEKHSEQFNQINAISVACSNDVQECTEMATKLFKDWRNGTNRIPPNLKSSIYCSAIASGDEDDWNFAWNQYEKASIATEKDKLRYALSCTKKIWLLNRYLEYTLEPSKIRKMDAVSTINHIARNVAGQALAWDFIRAHWTEIEEYGSGLMSVGSLIDEVTERFSTEFELQQLKQFRREHYGDGPGLAARALEQAIERTEANIEWVKENKQTVLNWFLQESKDH